MPNQQPIASCRGRFLKRPFFATAPFSTLKPVSLPTLSSRAKRGICCFFLLGFILIANSLSAQTHPERPRITGIAQVRILTTAPSEASKLYGREFSFANSFDSCVGKHFYCFMVNDRQRISILPSFYDEGGSRIADILFETSDIDQLREYLVSQNVKVEFGDARTKTNPFFTIRDPEDHSIGFVQYV